MDAVDPQAFLAASTVMHLHWTTMKTLVRQAASSCMYRSVSCHVDLSCALEFSSAE